MSDKKEDYKYEIAKNFIETVIIPPAEELGLLVKDHISVWRFKRQIKALNEIQTICKDNNISTKNISPKLLSPLLENLSLEDDELLQDKWNNLFVNMIDSSQNIQNHVFPYILSQLSKDEYSYLEKIVLNKKEEIIILTKELKDWEISQESQKIELESKLKILEEKENRQEIKDYHSDEARELREKKRKLESEIRILRLKSFQIKRKINAPTIIFEDDLQDFEIANIIRLGLAKSDYETSAGSHSIDIPMSSYEDEVSVDFDIDIETEITTIVTELGELFIEACCNHYPKKV